MTKYIKLVLCMLVLNVAIRTVFAVAADHPVIDHPEVKIVPPAPPQPPAFTPGAGTYPQEEMVMIWDPTPGVIIYYTTDGSTPTTSSSRYGSPAAIGRSVTLKAIAVNGNGKSIVSSGVYTINKP
jgi:hypothetical protein